MDKQKIRTSIKYGNSLCIPLTKELKKIGVSKGDNVFVLCFSDYILITTKESYLNSRIVFIDRRDYDRLFSLVKKYEKIPFEEYLNQLFKREIEKYTSIWKRPIIRI